MEEKEKVINELSDIKQAEASLVNSSTQDYEILSDDFPAYDLSFKVIIVGNSGVGKSCLAVQAIKKVFIANSLSTIGFEFMTFIIRIKKQIVKLQIWDTCGQEVYRSLITNYYKSSAMAILVYSIDE